MICRSNKVRIWATFAFTTAIFLCLLAGCGIKLTQEQEEAVKSICENKDLWGSDIFDSGQYNPINTIYISEQDGKPVLTVAYVFETIWHGKGYLGKAYDVESFEQVSAEKTIGALIARGITVDLKTMSDEELKACAEQSYLDYLSAK